jgi:RimJ/RimL family protein N-acetyltransferase
MFNSNIAIHLMAPSKDQLSSDSSDVSAAAWNRLTLVPYLPHHVPRYHQWMTRTELLAATASEPLSLEEEYENQQSWASDPHKLTFIIVVNHNWDKDCGPRNVMVGDVNMFLSKCGTEGELEIMLAEETARGKGLAVQVLVAFMFYVTREVPTVKKFVVKISKSNAASIALFRRKLGFEFLREVVVFEEIHFALDVSKFLERLQVQPTLPSPLQDSVGLTYRWAPPSTCELLPTVECSREAKEAAVSLSFQLRAYDERNDDKGV